MNMWIKYKDGSYKLVFLGWSWKVKDGEYRFLHLPPEVAKRRISTYQSPFIFHYICDINNLWKKACTKEVKIWQIFLIR